MTKPSNAYAKLSEEALKAALIKAWEQVEPNTREKMAPLLYYLHKKILARGQKGKGFERFVSMKLGIAVRTASRWVSWYAEQIGEKPLKEPTIGHVAGSDEDEEEDEGAEEDEEEDETEPVPEPEPGPEDVHPVKVQIMLTKAEEEQWDKAIKILLADADRIIFDAVIQAADAKTVATAVCGLHNAANSAQASV